MRALEGRMLGIPGAQLIKEYCVVEEVRPDHTQKNK